MRIFTGLPIPVEVIENVKAVCHYLKETYPGLSIVKPDGLHVTLHFFGEMPKHSVEKLIQLMDDHALKQKKIEVSFNGFGQFPLRGNPRVIFIQLDKGSEEITEFYNRYIKLIVSRGFGKPDTKQFVSHITVARNKRERLPRDFHDTVPFTLCDSFTIDRCILYESILTSGGAEYNALKTILFTS